MLSTNLTRLAIALGTLSLVLLLLTGCKTTGSVGIKASASCHIFTPITWSHKDTLPTVSQIIQHNAVYKSVCA